MDRGHRQIDASNAIERGERLDGPMAFGLQARDFEVRIVPDGTVTTVRGVLGGAASAGLKRSGRTDLAVIALERVGMCAGVFTSNKAAAAPVQSCRRLLARESRFSGVVVNSGCANALTGEKGLADAETVRRAATELIGLEGAEALVASTGLIGTELPVDAIVEALRSLRLESGEAAGHAVAEAIMTTDTVPKEVAVRAASDGEAVLVGGVAKGAAMLAPSMATMLAFLVTDAAVGAKTLDRLLRAAVAKTFNRLSVDACQSTNDTVLLFGTNAETFDGGGDAGTRFETEQGSTPSGLLEAALEVACAELALAMARDAEGSERLAVLKVEGAASPEDAEAVAGAIAASTLVRCSLHGADPYWGRVVSEAGSAAKRFDADRTDVLYGPHRVCAGGKATAEWRDPSLQDYMTRSEIEITLDLGLGPYSARRIVAALGPGYVEENMKTS